MKDYIKSLFLFFFLSYFISWVIWLPLYLPKFGINSLPIFPFHHAFGAIGPASAAFIVSKIDQGTLGIKNLFSKMFRWEFDLIWYIVALFSPFILLALSVLARYFISSEIKLAGIGVSREFPNFNFALFFFYNVITFGFGEEIGWRGYALPKLQKHFQAFTSTMILTLGWAVWHIPLFFYRPGYIEMGFFGIIGWVMSLFTGAILLTWLFNSTRGSILIVAIFHGTIDIVFTSNSIDTIIMNITGFLLVVFAICILLFNDLKNLSQVDRQTD
ncbi:CPBP family intramembrane metalloprotease [Leptospira hartskeerlii]|uniref:CPBP family intramembrane metalloprotease n=1 Tax=Leptospira hartskeerlii TaxID=2023177 RepID=A0A2M9XB46_9LEPT|nr:type II CAAX endopeptidase family protein [Leptospira hartskeerlii]PJZ24908.1 CPBP family intramembrane metalloprotease [Leptospira hartskeerlii]PJZ33283.1 CPBP family intramembrane metalloprotease [Leptospira hartskeerlii]